MNQKKNMTRVKAPKVNPKVTEKKTVTKVVKTPKTKEMTKVMYDVVYTPKLATEVFSLMSNMDLGIVGGEYPVCYRYTWNTTTKVDQKYRQQMRRAITKGLKAQGITQIHSIKKVK